MDARRRQDTGGAGGARTGYAIAAVGALVASYVLAWLVDWAEATSLLGGGGVGLVAWIGFVATSMAVNTWFAGRPLELYVIDGGYPVVSYVVMGAILAAWD